MIIIKIGGSVITDKNSKYPKLNKKNLKRVCKEICEVMPFPLILVHGAGSFGHPIVKKYDIIANPNKKGFCIVHYWVKKLNLYVCRYLLKYGMDVVSIQPSSCIIASDGFIDYFNVKIIERYLEKEIVPVLYGDIVLDKSLEFSVISGDQIVRYLGEKMKANKIILATDVDGVYDKDPKKHKDAKLIKRIKPEDKIKLKDFKEDVTGGMAGKVSELLKLAEKGVKSEIVNAKKKNRLKKLLLGKRVRRTIIG
ncbi:aspartate/glutamate/uridylate kinase [Methanothermus fervidus DSM 2088]|uniref:Isopentenyl phosphate kinase n=1 Tax=Methanothermus fervidus (strain ATCC 43054 / DSM 2088 / JCM 10308 / V24 S) TaxID=523846 RepID=E3GZG2_METFV|nr:isopentenyl phosphate kinase [Methanothermus fervidus]ADP77694.1 aspartate/glutamate/uridylate kinase [Methanothermus fervidus DSM 2088]